MRFLTAKDCTGERPGTRRTSRRWTVPPWLHWTDAPYVWHVNDGTEVFVVLDGAVDMHYRVDGVEQVQRLVVGDVCHASQETSTSPTLLPRRACSSSSAEAAGRPEA